MAVQSKPATWDLSGISLIAFAHGASDFFSGIVPLVIFFDVSRAHLPAWYQGSLAFLWYVTSSIVQPLFGAYSDRNGKWWFMPAAVALTVTAISFAGATDSIPLLALLIVIGGLGSAIMHPEAGKYSAMLSANRRTSAISIFQIGGQIGYGLGPIAIGVLLGTFGPKGSLWLLIPGVLAVMVIFALMRGVATSARAMHATHLERQPATSTRVDRFGVGLLVASTSLRHLVGAAFAYYLPNLLTLRGYSIQQSGTVVTGFLVFAAIGLYAGGVLSDRFGAVRVSVLSLCAAVPVLAAALLLGGWMSIACLLLGSVLLSVQNAPGVALVQAMLPRNLGMALGLMNGVAFGIGSAGVAIVGVAITRTGPTTALLAISLVPFVSALSYVLVARRIGGTAPAIRPA